MVMLRNGQLKSAFGSFVMEFCFNCVRVLNFLFFSLSFALYFFIALNIISLPNGFLLIRLQLMEIT